MRVGNQSVVTSHDRIYQIEMSSRRELMDGLIGIGGIHWGALAGGEMRVAAF